MADDEPVVPEGDDDERGELGPGAEEYKTIDQPSVGSEATERETRQERLQAIAERLGIIETTEMAYLRNEIVGARVFEEVRPQYIEYNDMGQSFVEDKEGDAYAAAQLGLEVAKARIWEGRVDCSERYVEAIHDALQNADMLFYQAGNELVDQQTVKDLWELYDSCRR